MDEFDYRKFENWKRTQHKTNAYDIKELYKMEEEE